MKKILILIILFLIMPIIAQADSKCYYKDARDTDYIVEVMGSSAYIIGTQASGSASDFKNGCPNKIYYCTYEQKFSEEPYYYSIKVGGCGDSFSSVELTNYQKETTPSSGNSSLNYPFKCNYTSSYGDYSITVRKNSALVTSGYMSNITTVTTAPFNNGCPSTLYFCEITNPYSTEVTTTYSIGGTNCTNGVLLTYKPDSGTITPGTSDSGEGSGKPVNCEYLFGDPDNSNDIAYWLQWSMNLMKYIGIIALFILSTVDFVKALIQNDQDALKKAGMTTAKRFIFCVILFFLPIIIDFAMTLLGAYGTCNIG